MLKHLAAHPNWRRWANIAVIVAGVWVTLIVMWSPEAAGPRAQQIEVADNALWFYTLAAAGPLAIAAVLVALRHAAVARAMLGVAGVALIIGLLGFRAFGTLAWGTMIIPAIIMLLAIPFLGPMPTPEEEGQVRHGLGHAGERDVVDPEGIRRERHRDPRG
jgi:hypothetical protein